MKFFIAILVLSSLSAFADDSRKYLVKCFEAPQQNGTHKVAYKFIFRKGTDGSCLDPQLIFPRKLELSVEVTDAEPPQQSFQCLVHDEEGDEGRRIFEACPGEGQRINGLLPIEVNQDETVYCERDINVCIFKG